MEEKVIKYKTPKFKAPTKELSNRTMGENRNNARIAEEIKENNSAEDLWADEEEVLNKSFRNENDVKLNSDLQKVLLNASTLNMPHIGRTNDIIETFRVHNITIPMKQHVDMSVEGSYESIMIFFEKIISECTAGVTYEDILKGKDVSAKSSEILLNRIILNYLLKSMFIGTREVKDEKGETRNRMIHLGDEMTIIKNELNDMKTLVNFLHDQNQALTIKVLELEENAHSKERKESKKVQEDIEMEKVKSLKETKKLLEEQEESKFGFYQTSDINEELLGNLEACNIITEGINIKRTYKYNMFDGKLKIEEISPYNQKALNNEIAYFNKFKNDRFIVYSLSNALCSEETKNNLFNLMRTNLYSLTKHRKRINNKPVNAKYYKLMVSKNRLIVLERIEAECAGIEYFVEYEDKPNTYCFIRKEIKDGIKYEVNNAERNYANEGREQGYFKKYNNLNKNNIYYENRNYRNNYENSYNLYNNKNYQNGYNKGYFYRNRDYNWENRNYYRSNYYNRNNNNGRVFRNFSGNQNNNRNFSNYGKNSFYVQNDKRFNRNTENSEKDYLSFRQK